MRVQPLEPRRIRYPKGAYGWVELKIVTEGYLQALDREAALTYLFLCTVGNREGISFWSRPRIAHTLNLSLDAVDTALNTLSTADLIAVNDRIVQVLPVPIHCASPLTAAQAPTHPPKVIFTSPRTEPQLKTQPDVNEDEIRAHEAEARARIARFYGTREPSAGAVRALAHSLALKGKVSTQDIHDSPVDRRRP
jgi:hypothetical protein